MKFVFDPSGSAQIRRSERLQVFHCDSDLHLFVFDKLVQLCKLYRFLIADVSIRRLGKIHRSIK